MGPDADSLPEDRVLALVREVMTRHIPFNRVLGIELVEIAKGRVVLAIPFRPELVGDVQRPALHGGVLSALIDTAGGAAVWTCIAEEDRVSTVDLRVDYLRPARLETLHACAEVLRVGNRVGVVTVRAYHPSTPAETMAEGKGVYSVKRAGERDR